MPCEPICWLAFRSKKNLALPGCILLGTGVEPARAINAGDFKSPVSTIPPSEHRARVDFFDILPSINEGDSYGVRLKTNRLTSGGTFDPSESYSDLSLGTHVESIAYGNSLYEIAISSRIDTGVLWHMSNLKKRGMQTPS